MKNHILSGTTWLYLWQTSLQSFSYIMLFAAMSNVSRKYFALWDIASGFLLPYSIFSICLIIGSKKHEKLHVKLFLQRKMNQASATHDKWEISTRLLQFCGLLFYLKSCTQTIFHRSFFIQCDLVLFLYSSNFLWAVKIAQRLFHTPFITTMIFP